MNNYSNVFGMAYNPPTSYGTHICFNGFCTLILPMSICDHQFPAPVPAPWYLDVAHCSQLVKFTMFYHDTRELGPQLTSQVPLIVHPLRSSWWCTSPATRSSPCSTMCCCWAWAAAQCIWAKAWEHCRISATWASRCRSTSTQIAVGRAADRLGGLGSK